VTTAPIAVYASSFSLFAGKFDHVGCRLKILRTEVILLHLPLNLFRPVLPSLRYGVFTGHAGKVGHVAESRIWSRGWSEAVVPFAFGIADGGDVAWRWLSG